MRELARTLYDPIYRYWFRVEWEGLENIPPDGGALLVANHAGAIPSDAPVIMHGIETELGRPGLRPGRRPASGRCPVVGTLWSRVGGVPAHPDNAYRLLRDEQQLVLVFPEGTKGTGQAYGERYQLRRFGRGGFVEIAMRAGVPVVPIAVVGAEEAMPILCKSTAAGQAARHPVLPDHRQHARCSGPLGARRLLPGQVQAPGARPGALRRAARPGALLAQPGHGRVRAHPRSTIQEALYDMLRTRRSVWFGLSDGMRVLVTGLGTFWGGRVAQALEADPTSRSIVGLDTPRADASPLERTEYVRADESYSILARIVKATQVDTIVHTFLVVDSTQMQRPRACTRST